MGRSSNATMTEGILVTADEARELEEKSHETWHWREVDLRDWVKNRINILFKHRVLVDTETQFVEIWKTETYGEAFATSRKGNTEVTCNLDCRIHWRGKLKFNGGVVGTAEGTIKFPEVVASAPIDEWPVSECVCIRFKALRCDAQMKILADGEDP